MSRKPGRPQGNSEEGEEEEKSGSENEHELGEGEIRKQDKEDKGRCARGLMMKIFPCGTPTSWYDTESVERFPNPANRHNHIRQEHHGEMWWTRSSREPSNSNK